MNAQNLVTSCFALSLGLAGCASLPASPRYSFHTEPGQVYKTVDGHELLMDVYIPNISGPKAGVLVVHGGGWTRRAGDMEWICRSLARAGFVAFNMTYRLAPGSRFPEPVEDVRDAARWMITNAEKFEVDPKRVAGWGYSAGANLLLLAALDPALGLKALVSGGTPADLTVWPKSGEVLKFLGEPHELRPDLWKRASPVNYVRTDSPPVYLYHGSMDWIVSIEQLHKMEAELKKKNVYFESHVAPMMGHLWVYLFSQESADRGIDFLGRMLK